MTTFFDIFSDELDILVVKITIKVIKLNDRKLIQKDLENAFKLVIIYLLFCIKNIYIDYFEHLFYIYSIKIKKELTEGE